MVSISKQKQFSYFSYLVVSPLVSLDTDSLNRQKSHKRLRDLVVQASGTDFFNVNLVGMLQDLDLVSGNFAENSDGKTRAGEGVSTDQVGGNVEKSAKSSDLVYQQGVSSLALTIGT